MAFVYSCCFWFSLRLGGILIGIFSVLQGLALLSSTIFAQSQSEYVQELITDWINNVQLVYMKAYLENVRDDPEKYLTTIIILTCMYITLCFLYIYGAYMLNNFFMWGYILTEFLRLVALSAVVTTWLLILKQNTMDIGLLIGASVGAGFALLGMFYLWICAANLPIVINEIERDEQAATIKRLRQLLENNQIRGYSQNLDDLPSSTLVDRHNVATFVSRDVFAISKSNPRVPEMAATDSINNISSRSFLRNNYGNKFTPISGLIPIGR